MAMDLVSTVTVGSGGASSLQFTNIPQTGKDLLLVFSLRDNTSAVYVDLTININGSGSTRRFLIGFGSSVGNNTGLSNYPYGQMNAADSTANTFGSGRLFIANYTTSGAAKRFSLDTVTENNNVSAHTQITAGVTSSTNAITSLEILAWNSIVQHSSASLYIIS